MKYNFEKDGVLFFKFCDSLFPSWHTPSLPYLANVFPDVLDGPAEVPRLEGRAESQVAVDEGQEPRGATLLRGQRGQRVPHPALEQARHLKRGDN